MNQEEKQMEAQEIRSYRKLTKDRSANKTPLHMRKALRRAKNKVARKSRQINRRG